MGEKLARFCGRVDRNTVQEMKIESMNWVSALIIVTALAAGVLLFTAWRDARKW